MRPGQQQNKRGRGRGSNNNSGGGGGGNNFNRKGQNPLTRTYDSSGPDVKIRGTAQHIAEKYATLARDAQSSGDRVIAENYLQHAEHYYRIIAAAQAQMQERFQGQERQDYNGQDDRDGDDMDGNDYDDSMGAQPVIDQQPREQGNRGDQGRDQNRDQNRNRDNRGERQDRGDRQPRGERDGNRDNRGNRGDRNVAEGAEQVQAVKQDAAPETVAAVAETDEQPRIETRERQPRPRREPREPRVQAPVAAAVDDGTGPQPVIEGVPAEVAAEEAEATAAPRRRAAPRPRRQPRKTAEGAEGDTAGDSKAELADVAGE
ncbi:DUF4167 domain-containing protein [Neorhizobium sp. JUb45]|uniref:DUF4167 domain-containing protein n=1 Tax=unclassified Neorhizobium TaxID=2629175 RepID=UPI001046E2ED|nr:DUF4167 domain-containing protein [Neorhizobium sp. JUb45]TCR01003.1 uncharacterized protein DUF4167 [Neorhizobium sp. JUb45]